MTPELELHNGQKEAVEFAIKNKQCMLIGDIGSGKTIVALELIKRLKDLLLIDKALLIAPSRVIELTYPAELQKWKRYKNIVVSHLHSHIKVNELLKANSDAYLLPFSMVDWFYSHNPYRFQLIIIDESHFVKSSSTKRFKTLSRMVKNIQYRVAMTGTPIGNYIEDLWSQYYLIDEGKRLLPYKANFLREWFIPTHNVHVWKPKKGATKSITSVVSDITYRIESPSLDTVKEEKLIELSFPEETLKLYKELEKESFLAIQNMDIAAHSALSLILKLRQFCCGFLYASSTKLVSIHDTKYEFIQQYIRNINDNIMFVSFFTEEIRKLQKVLPDSEIINGATPKRKASIIVSAWNSKKIRYLIVHPKSGGTGLNLQKGGATQIWTSPDWSQLDKIQTQGRLFRQGQENPIVSITTLAFKDSIETKIIEALKLKIKTANQFVNFLRLSC